jgi:hypothetical protein
MLIPMAISGEASPEVPQMIEVNINRTAGDPSCLPMTYGVKCNYLLVLQ